MNNQGLSLLEVLIASTIMAFIAVSVVTITDSSVKTKESVLSEDEELLQVEMMFSILQNDFELIYTPLYFSAKDTKKLDIREKAFNNYDGNDRYEFATKLGHPAPKYDFRDGNTFTFLTFNNKRRIEDSKQSRFAWIRYTLISDYNRGNDAAPIESHGGKSVQILKRYKVAEDIYSREAIDWEKVKSHNLLTNVISMKYFFWDDKKEVFTDNFANVPEGKNILKKIKIKLTWVTKEGIEVEDERIYRSIWPNFVDDTPEENSSERTSPITPSGPIDQVSDPFGDSSSFDESE